jgi:carbonic anhydrase
MKYISLALISSASAFIFANLNATEPTAHKVDSHAVKASSHAVHWSYQGPTGPEAWGDLDPKFQIAKTGTRQSPIDLDATISAELAELEFDYQDSALTPLRVVNNGHTIQVNYEPGSHITVDQQDYELLQFHFHTPSEHTKQQRHSPMELHMVHKNADGQLAVVGVFIEEGQANSEIQKIWNLLPNEAAERVSTMGLSVNASKLLPAVKNRFQYNGSLTTPPCSEGVLWLVLENPIELATHQIDTFRQLFSGNARPIQSAHSRFILGSE